jgi:hypothetical protein
MKGDDGVALQHDAEVAVQRFRRMRNVAGVPVLDRVAASFLAIFPTCPCPSR